MKSLQGKEDVSKVISQGWGLIIFVFHSKVTGRLLESFLLSESYIGKGTRLFVISELQRFSFRKIKALVYLFPCTATQNTEKLSLNYLVAYAPNMFFVQYVSMYVNSKHQSPCLMANQKPQKAAESLMSLVYAPE